MWSLEKSGGLLVGKDGECDMESYTSKVVAPVCVS
jgi:hypothetical protein